MDLCRMKDFRRGYQKVWDKAFYNHFENVYDYFLKPFKGFDNWIEKHSLDKFNVDIRIFTNSDIALDIAKMQQDYRLGKADIYRQCVDVRDALRTIDNADRELITQALDGTIPRDELPLHLTEKYDKCRSIIDGWANKLVEAGMLKEDYKIEHYVKRIYEGTKFDREVAKNHFEKLKARRDLTPEERLELNQILDASLVVPYTIYKQRSQLVLANYLKELADRFGKDEPAEGYVKMEDYSVGGGVKVYGALSGKYVPKAIRESLLDFEDLPKQMNNLYSIVSIWTKIVDAIKVNLTAKNPATHFMNIASNTMLAFINGDLSSVSKVLAMRFYDRAKYDELVALAKQNGLEMRYDFLEDVFSEMELSPQKKDTSLFFKAVNEVLGGMFFMKGTKLGEGIRDLYGFEDAIFKLGNFHKNLNNGIPAKQAFELANDTYVNYQTPLPPALKFLDKIGLTPFINYTYKSTPALIRTILSDPVNLSRFLLLQCGLAMMGWSDWWNEDEDDYKPKWAGDKLNFFGAREWVRVNGDWFFNLGRVTPAAKMGFFDFFGGDTNISAGFLGAIFNILQGKNSLGYDITKKGDDVPNQILKKLYTAMETFLPPLSPLGRYGLRLEGAYEKVFDKPQKNYYGEVMGTDEIILRALGVRKFNTNKEILNRVNDVNKRWKKAQKDYKKGLIDVEAYNKAMNQYYEDYYKMQDKLLIMGG